MQIGHNDNGTSFGFNNIKFLDESAEQLFKIKSKHIKQDVLTKVLEEVKNIKPKSGPDVDVFIGAFGKDTKHPYSYLTYQEPNSLIRKGYAYIHEAKKHTIDGIIETFKNLANQVDERRVIEAEFKAERAAKAAKKALRKTS